METLTAKNIHHGAHAMLEREAAPIAEAINAGNYAEAGRLLAVLAVRERALDAEIRDLQVVELRMTAYDNYDHAIDCVAKLAYDPEADVVRRSTLQFDPEDKHADVQISAAARRLIADQAADDAWNAAGDRYEALQSANVLPLR
jgi:hypothetical protein